MQFAIDPMIASADRDGLAKADLCRQLNDCFRLTLLDGKVVLSQQVAGLPLGRQAEVVLAVRGFDDFSAENDPYEEHDFGAVVCRGERYFWKIDCYDLDLTYASPDPSDPAFTIRVLTIMRADEY
jgi:hypothetical protein